jgi:hypothetical protein
MVVGLKADGVWDKITEAYLMAGVTFGGITVKLKGSGTLTNNNFVSGDYQATGSGAGLTGNGSSKYLDTGFAPADGLTLGDVCLGAYGQTEPTGTFKYMIGLTIAGSFRAGIASNGATTNTYTRIADDVGFVGGSGVDNFVLVTTRSGGFETFENGVSLGQSTKAANSALVTDNFYLLGNNEGGVATNFSDATITFAHIGTGLTDTDASNLSNRVNKLMEDLGCAVYVSDTSTLDSEVADYFTAVKAAGGGFGS